MSDPTSDLPTDGPQNRPPDGPADHPRPAGRGQRRRRPPVSHVVDIRAKPGMFWGVLGGIAALIVLGIVFFVGVGVGVGGMMAGSAVEPIVLEQSYRESPSGSGDKIAILPVEGVIDSSQSQFVRAAVQHILKDSSFKAVVLRVDSPGGEVAPSDQIWYEVERLKAKGLPVVASYGGVAASGGYYVSCGADAIMAEPTCITGSIGVIAQIFTMHELMEKVGIEPVTLVATGSPEKSTGNDIFREWTEQDQQKWMAILDSAHETFTERVRSGRGNSFEDGSKLASVANGSIYTAQKALEHKLIDGIGYLDDAINEAERSAGLATNSAKVVRVTEPPSLFGNGLLMQGGEAAGQGRALHPAGGVTGHDLRGFLNDLSTPRAMYLMR